VKEQFCAKMVWMPEMTKLPSAVYRAGAVLKGYTEIYCNKTTLIYC